MATPPSVNPYLAPQVNLAEDYADDIGAYWRDGKVMVLRKDGQLPPRCTKCNADSAMPLRKKTLIWHHPAWYLLIFVHPIIYIIVGLIVRKRAKIEYGLCGTHLTRRRIGIAVSLLSFATASVSLFRTIEHGSNGLDLLVVIVGFLAAILIAVLFARSIYARRIDKDEIRIGGCGKPFLDSARSKVL
ncbi:MAG TPA: hypothetical protein VF798_06915 [Burkholderiaceae bacterium]